MTSVLGEEIYRMMRGEVTPKQALVRSQQRIDCILQARKS
jgi:hypothetical protein